MVTIKKIEIKGFFGKGDFEWNLDPVVNILGGKNGSGKSTIFKMCYAMLSDKDLLASMEGSAKKIFKEMTLTFSNNWTLYWPHDSETLRVKFEDNKPMAYIDSILVKDEKGKERKLEELQKQVSCYLINSFEQHLDKAIQYAQQPKSISLNNPTMLDIMIYDQINLRNKYFSETMENLIDSSEEMDRKRKEYAEIYKKTYSILENFLKTYDKPFKSSFEFSKDGEKFGYEHLSMGEKQILLLMLMVGNVNQKPCVFFMDEPDLSMHIDWKEILIKQLHELNPNMQIIVSTHAPSVITGWKDRVEEVNHLTIKK
jgi:predicted ATP-binding protein involved in virulence